VLILHHVGLSMDAVPTGSRRSKTAMVLALTMAAAAVAAQTRVTPPKNSYTPAQDVDMGRKAASEVEQQMPILGDDAVTSYVEGVGRRLVGAIPPDLQHPEFAYTFRVVNVRDINAFALPGGPMFVNRGMIEQAHDEGEVAGVMAHELSHVVLRHGTAQASRASKYQFGELAGAVVGAIIGGVSGRVISGVSQFGFGTTFLRFSREYEQQADLEGSQIMARAGYDPRDMANIFKTIEAQNGPGGPQFLSDHPNPGNRYEYINQEAQRLRVKNPVRDTRGFDRIQAHLRTLPRAPTTEEATKAAKTATAAGTGAPPAGGVARPSPRFASYTEGQLFRVSVPSNWREIQGSAAVTFAPAGAYGTTGGQQVFTHGVEIGVSRNETHDLRTATDELVASLAEGNRRLERTSDYRRTAVGDRDGLRAVLSNLSEATGAPEVIAVFTTLTRDGNLLYILGVAPRDEFPEYSDIFDRIVQTLRIS
jgi:hypothetical protein